MYAIVQGRLNVGDSVAQALQKARSVLGLTNLSLGLLSQ